MNTSNFSIDHRIAAGLKLDRDHEKGTNELYFQANGKRLFLSSVTDKKLKDARLDMFQHWLEESILNLPPYEKLLEVLEAEGSAV